MTQKGMSTKDKKTKYDVDDDTNICFSNEEISMFDCSSPVKEEIELPNDNTKSLDLWILMRSLILPFRCAD